MFHTPKNHIEISPKKTSLYNVLFSSVIVIILFLLAFQFYRLTKFPIGDDPAVHINNVKTLTYGQLAQLIYPLPILIFKAGHQLTHIDYPQLFVTLISTYLFLAGACLYFFILKGDQDMPSAAAASIIFITSRWVNDSLRMGVFAEVFSWSILLLALYALSKQNLIAVVITTGLLAFSHPFALTVYILILMLYSLITLFGSDPKEKLFVRNLAIVFSILAIIVYFLKPSLILGFLHFNTGGDPAGWGVRSLFELVTADDPRRIFVAIMAAIGAITGLKDFHKPFIKISYLLLVVGLFLSLNQIFDIQFLPFRFYGYLEMGLALFAGLGITQLLKNLYVPKGALASSAVILGLMLAWPSYFVNESYVRWQTTDPSAHAYIFPEDRAALDWIKTNTDPDAFFESTPQHGLWLTAYADRKNIRNDTFPYSEKEAAAYFKTNSAIAAHYIYYSFSETIPPTIAKHTKVVYSTRNVKILKVLNVSP